jgi:uncharacterized protein (TIGR02145 family)
MTTSLSFRISPLLRFCALFAIAGTSLLSSCELFSDEEQNPTNNRSLANFNPDLKYGNLTDIDGNIYRTITIGDQIWMAENLRVTHYNDGSIIPLETDKVNWNKLTLGAFFPVNQSNSPDSIATFGRLYNWHAIKTGKLAPKGWHVPTYADWNVLLDNLGGKNTAGGKMKETGFIHWNSPNADANNSSGFTAIASGMLSRNGFSGLGEKAAFWCNNSDGTILSAYYFWLTSENGILSWSVKAQTDGLSIRCVKD